jgi:small multidrug resistance family-3 protein
MRDALVSALGYLPYLIVSALLEVGGDAGMRSGLQGRRGGYALGALLLITYGVIVNLPKWNFGRLLGVYIAVFFVVSQVVAVTVFQEKLNAPALVGGALIIAGGLTLTLWHPT